MNRKPSATMTTKAITMTPTSRVGSILGDPPRERRPQKDGPRAGHGSQLGPQFYGNLIVRAAQVTVHENPGRPRPRAEGTLGSGPARSWKTEPSRPVSSAVILRDRRGFSLIETALSTLDRFGIMNADGRIDELKLQLPPAPKPVGVYLPLVLAGNIAYVSGHGPNMPDERRRSAAEWATT